MGLQTNGYHACSLCGDHLEARHSKHLRKMVYKAHLGYMLIGHPMCEGIMGHKPPMMQASNWYANGEHPLVGMKRLSIFYDAILYEEHV